MDEQDKLIIETGDTFRDKVSIIDKSGRRIWVYPKKPIWGRFQKYRSYIGYLLVAVFFLLPFVKLNGEPYFLMDLMNRKFIFFGTVWFPHDFYIFAIGLLAFAIFIVLFTAVFGRIFCGWVCPQTIFMELIYRKIEYLIEGDAKKQLKLNRSKLNFDKFTKKFSKHSIFLIIALVTNFFVFAYFNGLDGFWNMLFIEPQKHIGGNLAYVVISVAFWGNFSWFREQACTFVCPYGRLQSVLLDQNSIIVAYDHKRGEPRGKLQNGEIKEGNGDCINCGACVRVCPTGIDIRNGLQLECVNCTNCIDSCDEIMDKIGKPRGLIKYTSLDSIEKQKKFKFTSRLAFYSTVLTVLLAVFVFMIFSRSDVEANILRARGSTFFVNKQGNVSNIFTFKLINKTFDKYILEFRTENVNGKFKLIGTNKLDLKPEGILEGTFLLDIPKSELKGSKNEIEIGVYSKDKLIDVVETNFSGPK